MKSILQQVLNPLFYAWRSALPPVRKSRFSENQSAHFAQERIPLAIAEKMSDSALRLSLFYLWILEGLPAIDLRAEPRLLDLGSKDFAYAPGLAAFLSRKHDFFTLDGLEMDPYRLYSNFFRRGDAGEYYASLAARGFGNPVSYQTGDWLKWRPQVGYDLITCFFPFLFSDLHDRFGLPRRAFNPQKFYSKIFRQSPLVIFFHQGEDEAEESLRLIRNDGSGRIVFIDTIFENPWMKREFPTSVFVWRRNQ